MAQLKQDRKKKSLPLTLDGSFLQKQGPVGEHQQCQDLAPVLLLLQAQALYAKQQPACVNWGDDAIITQTICYTCTHWKHTPKPEFLKNLQLRRHCQTSPFKWPKRLCLDERPKHRGEEPVFINVCMCADLKTWNIDTVVLLVSLKHSCSSDQKGSHLHYILKECSKTS